MVGKPSDTELILLRALWSRKQLSAREVHNDTVAKTNWAYSTTRKTLDRMVVKKILKVEQVHGMKTFLPSQSKIDTMAVLISHFTKKILDTDEPLPAAAFINSRLVDESELDELQEMLEKLDCEASDLKSET